MAVGSVLALTYAFGSILGAGSALGYLATTLTGKFLLSVAASAILGALSPKPSSAGSNRGYQTNTGGTALDHQIVYGEVKVGGAILYDETTGSDNKFLHRIIGVAGHEIESFERIYINDEYIDVSNISASGNVPLVYSSDGQETSDRYNGKVTINFHLGSPDQLADADLVSASTRWTDQHRLRGIAYMYIKMEYDQDTFPNGIPIFTATIKGKKVKNPATGLTTWSDNPALCLRDYLTSTGYGLAEDEDNIDDALVNTAASVCNQTNTDAGTKRFTCNGSFTTGSTPYDTISNLLTSMGGTMWYAQGKWRMKPAYWTASVMDLNEDDLRSSISVSTRHSRRDNFNTVKGTFRGEESNWQVTDYPQRTKAAFVAADGGQESVADVNLSFTDTSVEARRLALITLERNRQQLTISASFGLRTLGLQVGDNIRITNSRFGWVNKYFEVVSWNFGLTDGLDLQTEVILRETSESVFDEVADGIVYERDNTNLPNPFNGLGVTNLAVNDGGRTQSDGTFVPSALFSWDAADTAFVSYYKVTWKPLADSSYASTTTTGTSIELSPIVDAVEYVFRVQAISVLGNSGSISTITYTTGGDVTAPNLPILDTPIGTLGFINIYWTNPSDKDFSHVEIWESNTSSFSAAVNIAEAFGDSFNRGNLGPLVTKYYWIRSVDLSSNKSAFVGPVSATTSQITNADLGPATIQYDNFAVGITDLFDDIATDFTQVNIDLSQRVLVSDYNITVDYQQQLENATTQLATDALTLALNASSLESRVNDAGITVDPATGSVTIQGLSAIQGRVNEVEIDLNAVEGELVLKATTSYVNNAIAAATLPEASIAALEGLEARVGTVEVDLNSVEGSITLTSTGSLYNVNDGVLGVEALEGRISINEGSITLKASQTEMDDVETRLGSAEITLNSIDAPSIALSVREVRSISEKQTDLALLTLKGVLGRYKDREYVLQDSAYARLSLTADVNDEREARAVAELELSAEIGTNSALLLSEQVARADADSALAEDITSLESTVIDLDAGIVGNATAVSSLTTRVSSAEGTITSQSNSITTLQSGLTTVDGLVSGNATAVSSLTTRVSSAEGNITAQSTSITNLQSGLTTVDGLASGNATAISGLTTRVSSAEGNITAQSNSITNLQSGLTTVDGLASGNATAISGLTTRVSSAEGTITTQASALTSLTTTVGTNTTTVNQAVTSINGIEGKYGVSIDNNGNASGFQLLSGASGSAFNVRADQFAVFDANNNGGVAPFTIFTAARTISGVVYPAGTYIKNARIDEAAIINGSITTAKINNLAVTTGKIADLSVDTLQIKGEAVTVANFGIRTTGVSIAQSWVDICSVNINCENEYDVFCIVTASSTDSFSYYTRKLLYRVVHEGSPFGDFIEAGELEFFRGETGPGGSDPDKYRKQASDNCMAFMKTAPGNGVKTFKLQGYHASSNGAARGVAAGLIRVQMVKR